MPPASNKVAAAQLEAVNNNVLVLLGRLLEATEAAQVGLRTLDEETRRNTANNQALKTMVEQLATSMQEIEKIVRGNSENDSLSTHIRQLVAEAGRLRIAIAGVDERFDKRLTEHDTRLDKLERDDVETGGRRTALRTIVEYASWIVVTGIALYAAIGQWFGGGNAK